MHKWVCRQSRQEGAQAVGGGGRFHEGHRPESANISEHPKTNNCYVNDEARKPRKLVLQNLARI